MIDRYDIAHEISNIVSNDAYVSTDVSMKEKTSFHIGGCADIFIEAATPEDVIEATRFCKKNNVPAFIIGRGSNLLVADSGIRGVVIQISSKMSDVSINDTFVRAQAGISNARLSKIVAEAGLSGYEFASGIPGAVGGALYMNAGAYEHEIADIVVKATCLNQDLEVENRILNETDFGYRDSCIAQQGLVVLDATFQLTPDEPDAIKARMREINRKRMDSQPLSEFSAGSAFKRPDIGYAAALIEQAGLKGCRINGAKVSEKHSGFIVNDDHATAEDVRTLVCFIRKQVFEKFGVMLEPEIRMIGFE